MRTLRQNLQTPQWKPCALGQTRPPACSYVSIGMVIGAQWIVSYTNQTKYFGGAGVSTSRDAHSIETITAGEKVLVTRWKRGIGGNADI